MKYNQPFDAVDPNGDAPYINGNPAASIRGSIPPAAQMEYPQREIVYCIKQAGLAPSNDDLTQLWQAIRFAVNSTTPSGSIIYRGVNTGSVNDIVATMTPVLTAYEVGGVYMVKLDGANTGAATANLGPGDKPLLRSNGTPLRPKDMSTLAVLTYDGTNLILANLAQEIAPPGSGFAGAQRRFGYMGQAGQPSNLTATFVAAYAGVVIAFSTLNQSPSNGNASNEVSITVDGASQAGAADNVPGASSSTVSVAVAQGASVTVRSKVIPVSDSTFGMSQYLNYVFIPG